MFVKPAPGLKIRDPRSRLHIPESGTEVPDDDSYWVRRLRSGDVIEEKNHTEEKHSHMPKEEER